MGPLTYGKKEQEVFLGREISVRHRDYSDDDGDSRSTRLRCDDWWTRAINSAHQILEDNRDVMHRHVAGRSAGA